MRSNSRCATAFPHHDLAHLGAYHAAVRLVLGGEQAQPFTMLTQPLPPAVPGRAREIRAVARRAARTPANRATTDTTSAEADVFGGGTVTCVSGDVEL